MEIASTVLEPWMPSAAARALLDEERSLAPRSSRRSFVTWKPHSGTPVTSIRPSPLPDETFERVLVRRRSSRKFGKPSAEETLAVLVHAARMSGTIDDVQGSYRVSPTPSAGARHPCEVVAVVNDVDSLQPGLYWFDRLRAQFVTLDDEGALRRESNSLAALALHLPEPPPVVLVIVAQLSRTLSSYVGGLSLVLRDAGALIATMSLVATSLGLASCPIGTCNSSKFSAVLGGPDEDWVDLGGLAIGRPTR